MATSTALPAAASRVPGSRLHGLALIGALRHDPLATFTQVRREQGMIARLRLPFRTPVYLVSDPDAIHEALTLTNRSYAKGFPRRRDLGNMCLRWSRAT